MLAHSCKKERTALCLFLLQSSFFAIRYHQIERQPKLDSPPLLHVVVEESSLACVPLRCAAHRFPQGKSNP